MQEISRENKVDLMHIELHDSLDFIAKDRIALTFGPNIQF